MLSTLPRGCALHELAVRGDARGSLVAIQEDEPIGFAIARVYYIFGTDPAVARGFHAHHNLRQLAVCVSGGCTLVVDDGATRTAVRLDRPDLALAIGPMTWREMHDFTPDCVLMVLADQRYDEADYIRDLAQFRRLTTA